MHDTNKQMAPGGGQGWTRKPLRAPQPAPAETHDLRRWVELDANGNSKPHVSSGPDWHGRYGRRPEPRLHGDERRIRVTRHARRLQEHYTEIGLHEVARRIGVRLHLWLQAHG